MARSVLVLGGQGSFGEAICAKLLLLGYRVVIITHDAKALASGSAVHRPPVPEHAVPVVTSVFCNAALISDCIRHIDHQVGLVEVIVVTPDGLPKINNESSRPHAATALTAAYLDMLSDVAKWASADGDQSGNRRIIHIAPNLHQGNCAGPASAQLAPIAAFNRQRATELAPIGVSINMIVPAYAGQMQPPSVVTAFIEQNAHARRNAHLSEQEEVALLVAYLASDEASSITGAHIAINGGYQSE